MCRKLNFYKVFKQALKRYDSSRTDDARSTKKADSSVDKYKLSKRDSHAINILHQLRADGFIFFNQLKSLLRFNVFILNKSSKWSQTNSP